MKKDLSNEMDNENVPHRDTLELFDQRLKFATVPDANSHAAAKAFATHYRAYTAADAAYKKAKSDYAKALAAYAKTYGDAYEAYVAGT